MKKIFFIILVLSVQSFAVEVPSPEMTGETRPALIVPALETTGTAAESQPVPPAALTTPEQPALPKEETTKEAEAERVPEWIIERDRAINRQFEELILNIRDKDKDTGEMPEAGFSVQEGSSDLDRIISQKEKGLERLEFLYKELKNGFLREKILRALAGIKTQKSLDVITLALKDKSSEIRLLAARILGEESDPKIISKITSLLYDKYMLRRDVFPVRAAAKQAIELLKFKETLPAEEKEKISALISLIKDKAMKGENYFCDYAAKAIGQYPEAKELIRQEITKTKEEINEPGGAEKTRILGYLVLASAELKDEAAAADAEENLKNPQLYYLSALSLARTAKEKLIDRIIPLPEGADAAELFLNMLKEESGEFLEMEVPKPVVRKETIDEYAEKLEKMIIKERSIEAYKKAAEVFAYGIGDYDIAVDYLKLYENSVEALSYDPEYIDTLAFCLASAGKPAEALSIDPLFDIKPFHIYQPLINIMTKKISENGDFPCRKLRYLADFYYATGQYRRAADILLQLNWMKECIDLTTNASYSQLENAGNKIKEKIDPLLKYEEPAGEEGVSLEIKTGKEVYKTGENIAIKITVRNNRGAQIYILNDTEGNLGFDAGVFSKGFMIKRIKNDLTKRLENSELIKKIFVVNPEAIFEAEVTLLSGAENNAEGEYDIILSYLGGEAIPNFENGWIKNTLLSNRIKIRVEK